MSVTLPPVITAGAGGSPAGLTPRSRKLWGFAKTASDAKTGFSFAQWAKAKKYQVAAKSMKGMSSRQLLEPLPTTAHRPTGEGSWSECFDEESQTTYYFNDVTGESRWDNPAANYVDGAAGGGAPPMLGGHHRGVDEAHWFPSCPKPTLLTVARASVSWNRLAKRKHEQEVYYIEQSYIEYERQKQAEIQAEIDRVTAELASEVGENEEEDKDMMAAFANLTRQDEKKEDEKRFKDETERAVDAAWEEYKTEAMHRQGAVELEKARQRLAAAEKRKAKEFARLRKRIKEIDAQIVAKRVERKTAVDEAHSKFHQAQAAHDAAFKLLRRKAELKAKNLTKHAAAEAPETAAEQHKAVEITGEGDAAEWVQLVDPATQVPYYFNSVTHATQWDAPEGWTGGYTDPGSELAEGGFNAVPEHAALGGPESSAGALAGVHDESALDEAHHLAEEWVTQDMYDWETRKTAEMQGQLDELLARLNAEQTGDQDRAMDLLAALMEWEQEETEEDTHEELAKIREEFEVATQRVSSVTDAERQRQKDALAAKLEKKKRVLAKRVAKRQHRKLKTSVRLVHSEFKWLKRRTATAGRRRRGSAAVPLAQVRGLVTLTTPTAGRRAQTALGHVTSGPL